MKLRKNNLLILAILSMTVWIAGCSGPNSQIISETEAESAALDGSVEFPKYMKQEINGVAFDLNLEVPENLELSKVKKSRAARQIPKVDSIVKVLGKNEDALEAYKDKFEGENGIVYDTYYAKYSDESLLSVDTAMVYSTSFFEKIHNSFRIEKSALYNADKYISEANEFETPEICFEQVKKQINLCGYKLDDCDYKYYTLDYNTMRQEEIQLDKAGEVSNSEDTGWSAEDNCYYFFAEQVHNGIPVYFGEQDFPQDNIENRPFQVVYSKDGIKRLDITKLYTFESMDENVNFKGFEEIANKVAEKYGNILTDAKYEAARAKLYQMPVKTEQGEYEVKVIWLFEIKETGIDSESGENFENTLYTCINAETGEEVSI